MQELDVVLADSQRLIEAYHEPGEGATIQIALAPCSPFSVTTQAMSESARLAGHYGVRLHTHLAETLDEEEFCLSRFGLRPLDYLDSVGWLGPHTCWGTASTSMTPRSASWRGGHRRGPLRHLEHAPVLRHCPGAGA